ncbi:putative addiction module antidote protein [Pseudoxanthomonas daejeonensis]|uniref:addiction module antidote protein n=1 Tax=Pseudoxanthomonas daejeonensis TaxID=266062 RepID=UPI001F5477DD|nr:addiction module antidote protein [Pseudoxanthomonas daejeonensis]UNK56183.1 putative addiction module antidote protein [Pseudoxanthomonas daejeonensis]
MTKTSTFKFDPAEYLDDVDAMASYLSEALESGDATHFQEAVQTVARARGMARIAEESGLGRESLYKSLRPEAAPRFDTMQRILKAVGVTLRLEPTREAARASKGGKSATPSMTAKRMPIKPAAVKKAGRKKAAGKAPPKKPAAKSAAPRSRATA